jgi:hypothetical protein
MNTFTSTCEFCYSQKPEHIIINSLVEGFRKEIEKQIFENDYCKLLNFSIRLEIDIIKMVGERKTVMEVKLCHG